MYEKQKIRNFTPFFFALENPLIAFLKALHLERKA